MTIEHDEKYAGSGAQQTSARQDKLTKADFDLLELHQDHQVKKAYIGTCHGVIASQNDDWRSKANKKPKIVTVR